MVDDHAKVIRGYKSPQTHSEKTGSGRICVCSCGKYPYKNTYSPENGSRYCFFSPWLQRPVPSLSCSEFSQFNTVLTSRLLLIRLQRTEGRNRPTERSHCQATPTSASGPPGVTMLRIIDCCISELKRKYILPLCERLK